MSLKLITQMRTGLSSEVSTPPSSQGRSSIEERVSGIQERLELASSPKKSPITSPERPSKNAVLARLAEDTPRRTKLAERLTGSELSLKDAQEDTEATIEKTKMIARVLNAFSTKEEKPSLGISIRAPLSQEVPELLITKAPFTRSKSREANRRDLNDLITRCESRFFECAKSNSTKKQSLNFIEFKPVFGLFRDLLLKIESKDFLDHYIVRDSQVGANKDLLRQKSLEEFHGKILQLRDELNKIGIHSLEDSKSVNFWSGREGQQRAADDTCSFSDSDIPFFKFLFDCWGYIKNRELMKETPNPFLTSMLPNLFSAIFASHAKGEVNVYMSSKNDPTADSSIINIDSAFWGAELYHLTNNEQVVKVNLYLHMGKDDAGQDKWSAPIDLKSKDKKVLAYKDSAICISKRGDASLHVSMGTLKNIGQIWKERAIKDHLLDGSEC